MSAAAEWRRLRLSVDLLIQRRAGLYVIVDLFVLLGVLMGVLISEDSRDLYGGALLPILLLGVPILADAVALERRAGSLDLVLSSPGASLYFERRVGLFCAIMAVQGCAILTLVRRLAEEPFFVLPAFVQIVVTCALVGAVTLFWAVRLRSSGAVGFATLLTLGAFALWIFQAPIYERMAFKDLMDWLKPNIVMALGALVSYLYARRRLIRPERILF